MNNLRSDMICRRFFILVCFLLVGCVPDSVSRLFGSFIERYELENEQIVASEANWFKAFAVDKELMMTWVFSLEEIQ